MSSVQSQTPSYGVKKLLEDARGYGRVAYAARGSRIVHAEHAGASPRLPRDPACFVGGLHALVETSRRVTLYRWYDEGPAAEARLLGPWWSTHRPSAEIDPTRLSELHKTARSDLAIKRSWSQMQSVVEAELAPGARVFVGRIAPQAEESGELLTGGYIQFFVPVQALGFLRLVRNHPWVR
jgi:hypothetical protein